MDPLWSIRKVLYNTGYDNIASPGTTLHLRVRHCISGYDIASPGTTLHLRVRHCISGYDIASPGTTLQHRVRHCISGYDIASPGTTLHLRVRHYNTGYDIASPGTTLHLRVRHCISGYDITSLDTTLHDTENDIAQYGTRHNKDALLLFCPQYPSIRKIQTAARVFFYAVGLETYYDESPHQWRI